MKTVRAIMVLALLLAGAAPVLAEGFPGERKQLFQLADRVEHRAFKVLDEAQTEHRYPTRQQEAGIEAFRELAWVAAYFNDQVRAAPYGHRTMEDFQILTEAFTRATGWINRVPMDRDVHKDFQKLEKAYWELDLYLGPNRGGYARARGQRMKNDRYNQVLRTRVIPRVDRNPRYRRGRPRMRLDVGLSIPGGRVRIVWR